VAAIQQLLGKVQGYQGVLDKENAAALKIFDPHRSNGPESAAKLGLLPKDSAPYSTVFTNADNLRKQMIEQAKSMKGYEDSIEASHEEAKLQTLSPELKLPGYIKHATDLQVKVRTLTDRLSSKGVGAKNILDGGKEYKEQWAKFVETATLAAPDKKEVMKKMAKERMEQRYEQVKELEEGLKKTFVTAAELLKRGLAGIPRDFQTRPEVKVQTDGAMQALHDGKAFYDRWVKARTAAEGPYQIAVQTIDNA